MAISALNFGCAGFPEYPNETIYRPVQKYSACLPFIVIDKVNFKFDCVRDENQKCVNLPMSECDGIFGYKPESIVKINDWKRSVEKYAKEHCKAK